MTIPRLWTQNGPALLSRPKDARQDMCEEEVGGGLLGGIHGAGRRALPDCRPTLSRLSHLDCPARRRKLDALFLIDPSPSAVVRRAPRSTPCRTARAIRDSDPPPPCVVPSSPTPSLARGDLPGAGGRRSRSPRRLRAPSRRGARPGELGGSQGSPARRVPRGLPPGRLPPRNPELGPPAPRGRTDLRR